MADNKDDTNGFLPAAVKKLGAGYKGRRAWPARGPNHEAAAPVSAAGGDKDDKDDSVAAQALRAGFKYRRPLPEPDSDDDMALQGEDGKKASAVNELEEGLAAAANGPPHQGGGDCGDGEDGDADGLSTAHSSPLDTSLDTEDVVAFAMEWEDDDGAGGQQDKSSKPAPSYDPANFQEDREAARNLLSMGAFFSSTAKAMMEEHKRTRKEADMYMAEVTLATKKLKIKVYAVLSHSLISRRSSG